MEIVTALKATNIRITDANKWLFWNDSSEEWSVYTRRYKARQNTVLYSGSSLEEAIDVLIKE